MGNICADERRKPAETDSEKLKRSVKEMRKALTAAMSVDDHKHKKHKNVVRNTRREQNDLLGLHSDSRNFKYLRKSKAEAKTSDSNENPVEPTAETYDV